MSKANDSFKNRYNVKNLRDEYKKHCNGFKNNDFKTYLSDYSGSKNFKLNINGLRGDGASGPCIYSKDENDIIYKDESKANNAGEYQFTNFIVRTPSSETNETSETEENNGNDTEEEYLQINMPKRIAFDNYFSNDGCTTPKEVNDTFIN